ncbi:MAG: hypothetical protein GWO21_12160 [Gammaproteobacteria bacterium]|nr:hypothetical protein [Gammaproteobacteria bacterium]
MSVSIGGVRVLHARLHVPRMGAWFLDAALESDQDLSSAQQITITLPDGEHVLRGTVQRGGSFALHGGVRIVGGAAAWGQDVARKAYANDAGVKAATVISDLASELGETLGTVEPSRASLGTHWAREAGPAGKQLEAAAGTTPWWVDFDGVTHVAARDSRDAPPESYSVLEHDPVSRWVTLGVDSLEGIAPGRVLRAGLDEPVTIGALELVISPDSARAHVWYGGAGANAVAGALASVIEHVVGQRLHGSYRYRVVQMSGNRADLQVVRQAPGLPDMVRVPQWSAPGYHAELAKGAEVLVMFADGDRGFPVVTHAVGKDGSGHVPVSVQIAGGGRKVARQGDLVQCGGAGTICTLMPLSGAGAPPNNAIVAGVPVVISFSSTPPDPAGLTAKPLYGAISTGSPLVESG